MVKFGSALRIYQRAMRLKGMDRLGTGRPALSEMLNVKGYTEWQWGRRLVTEGVRIPSAGSRSTLYTSNRPFATTNTIDHCLFVPRPSRRVCYGEGRSSIALWDSSIPFVHTLEFTRVGDNGLWATIRVVDMLASFSMFYDFSKFKYLLSALSTILS